MRGVVCEVPDERLVVEILLSSHGFSEALHLSTALVTLAHHLCSQLSAGGMLFGLPWLQRVVSQAAHLLHTSSDYYQSEMTAEVCVCFVCVCVCVCMCVCVCVQVHIL